MIYSGHRGYLDDIATTVRETTAALKPHKQRFDFIVATGMSGVLVASPVCIRLHRPLVVMRKAGEKSHDHCEIINGQYAEGRWLFLDDFISLGVTYLRVRACFYNTARYVGAYLYETQLLSWDGDGLVYCPTMDQIERYQGLRQQRANTGVFST